MAAEGGGLRGGEDEEMPLAHSVEVNAMVMEKAEGWELKAHWTWAPEVVEQEQVRELAESWFHVLKLLVQHAAEDDAGGLTPSDLQLVNLTQEEIDLLEQKSEGVEVILKTNARD